MDDNQIRRHTETPDVPAGRTELPEWPQAPADEDSTSRLTHDPADAGRGAGAGNPPQDEAPPQAPLQRERIPAPTGPAWGTIAFGVVCLAVASGALTLQVADLSVDWRYAAPLAFAGVGVLLVLVGLIGLTGRRARE